ncbi:MAG: hypothetical protein V4671_01935 [Armatimonadota bacterium]
MGLLFRGEIKVVVAAMRVYPAGNNYFWGTDGRLRVSWKNHLPEWIFAEDLEVGLPAPAVALAWANRRRKDRVSRAELIEAGNRVGDHCRLLDPRIDPDEELDKDPVAFASWILSRDK